MRFFKRDRMQVLPNETFDNLMIQFMQSRGLGVTEDYQNFIPKRLTQELDRIPLLEANLSSLKELNEKLQQDIEKNKQELSTHSKDLNESLNEKEKVIADLELQLSHSNEKFEEMARRISNGFELIEERFGQGFDQLGNLLSEVKQAIRNFETEKTEVFEKIDNFIEESFGLKEEVETMSKDNADLKIAYQQMVDSKLLYSHVCNRCKNKWQSQQVLPIKCPSCQSKKWGV